MVQIILNLDDDVLEQVLHQAKAENLSSSVLLDKPMQTWLVERCA